MIAVKVFWIFSSNMKSRRSRRLPHLWILLNQADVAPATEAYNRNLISQDLRSLLQALPTDRRSTNYNSFSLLVVRHLLLLAWHLLLLVTRWDSSLGREKNNRHRVPPVPPGFSSRTLEIKRAPIPRRCRHPRSGIIESPVDNQDAKSPGY